MVLPLGAILLLALWGGGGVALAQTTFSGGGVTLSVDRQGDIVQCAPDADPGLIGGLGVYLYDGVARRLVPVNSTGAVADGDEVALTLQPDMPLTLGARLTRHGEALIVTLSVENTSDAQQLLEIGLQAQVSSAQGISVFDGHTVAEQPSEEFGRDEFMGRMNLCALWNERAGFGMGLAATELRSWFHHVYLPDGDRGRLRTVTRLVLDPGGQDTVSFFITSRPGEWGYREILEAYYNTWPELFRADPRVDPRIALGGAEYQSWHAQNLSAAAEVCRRLYGGWDWCYAPFRRTGDIYGREELWDYEPVRPFSRERAQSREDFHQWRREKFAAGRATNVAMMFYVPAQVWCEERLATGRYADALVEDPDVRTVFLTPWVTGNDNERLMFPYRTSLGEQSRLDMAQVVAELNMQGFAFDTAEGPGKYRGPALSRLDERAWDENGPYCRNSVAIARLMQFVHTLTTRDGRTAGVIGNIHPGGAYSSVINSDSIMLEGEPWKLSRDYPDPLRWKAGQKTIVFWEGYGLDQFIDLDQARPEQVRMALRGLADFTLLQSLRVGIIPPPAYTRGVERLAQWLPAIVECVQSGWQPVPAARVPEPCWATRYGTGTGTLIAIAHETAGAVEAEVVVENERIGAGATLLSHYDGRELTNTIRDGETVIEVEVPKRTPVLLRAQAMVRPATALRGAQVSGTAGATGSELQMTLVGNGQVEVTLRVPAGMAVAEVVVNDVSVPARGDASRETVAVELAGETQVLVRLRSELFQCDDEELLGFPFIGAGSACAISVPQGAGEKVRLAAGWLQGYFGYWRSVTDREQPAPSIVEGDPPAGPAVMLRTTAAQPEVRRGGDQLVIAAPDAERLKDTVWQVLGALDRRYFTAVPPAPYARQGEMSGGVLRWDERP